MKRESEIEQKETEVIRLECDMKETRKSLNILVENCEEQEVDREKIKQKMEELVEKMAADKVELVNQHNMIKENEAKRIEHVCTMEVLKKDLENAKFEKESKEKEVLKVARNKTDLGDKLQEMKGNEAQRDFEAIQLNEQLRKKMKDFEELSD